MKPTHHKTYYFDVQKDVIKYGDEGIKYRAKLPDKISHKINHNISHSDKEIKDKKDNIYLQPFKSKNKHHFHDHIDKVLDKLTDDKEKKQKAKEALHAVYVDNVTKPTHQDITPSQRQYAVFNEASIKYNHTGSQQQINNYLRENGIRNYFIDFDNSSRDGLIFVNRKTNKTVLALRGSSLSKTFQTDMAENAGIFNDTNFNNNYHNRLDELFENANGKYEIERIVGYSRGGHGALYLGNKHGIDTTTFNPFITPSNIKNHKSNKRVRHQIVNTTEDAVSALAPILKINNNNVDIRTINPIVEETALLNPISGHKNENFINDDLPRRNGRRFQLTEKIVSAGKKLGELDIVKKGTQIRNQGGSFTDFIKATHPNDVKITKSLIDGSETSEFSKRISGGSALTKIWNELGGNITMIENLKIIQNVTDEPIELETTRGERLNHAEAPYHIRDKNTKFLENELQKNIKQLENHNNFVNNVRENVTDIQRNIGLTPRGIGSVVVGSVVGGSIEEQQKQTGEFLTGAVTSALAGGKVLAGGGATLASAELGTAVSSLIDDKPTANIVNSAVTMGSLPVTEAIGEFAIGRVISGIGLAAVAPFVAPEIAVVAGLAALGAGIGALSNIIINKE
tara:strand:- start:121 stop:1998 length:1878 start_codon:yes stop_codon:yes gene_type:complete